MSFFGLGRWNSIRQKTENHPILFQSVFCMFWRILIELRVVFQSTVASSAVSEVSNLCFSGISRQSFLRGACSVFIRERRLLNFIQQVYRTKLQFHWSLKCLNSRRLEFQYYMDSPANGHVFSLSNANRRVYVGVHFIGLGVYYLVLFWKGRLFDTRLVLERGVSRLAQNTYFRLNSGCSWVNQK